MSAFGTKRTFARRPLPSQAGVRAVSISPTPERFEYVLALLASIRTAYFWTLSGYCWHARSTIRNEVLCGRFTRRLKLKSINNPNPKTKTKTMKAASRTKVVSGVANNSGVDRTSPVKGGPKARRANKPGQQVVSNANFKIKGPENAGPFLMGGSTIQPLRRLPLPH